MRIDRVFVASLLLHGLLVFWLVIRVFGPGKAPADEDTPMRWASEISKVDDSPRSEEPDVVDPPPPNDDVTPPEAQVIAEDLEPAPWLRPEKAEHRPGPGRPEESASTRRKGLSATYRQPEQPVKTPAVTKSEPLPEQKKAEKEAASAQPAKKKSGGIFVAARKKEGACKSPPYPRRALRRRLAGKVSFLVDVGTGGDVLSIQLERSSGHDILDRAARAAIKDWQFVPARRDGVAVRDRVRATMKFVLPD